MKTFKIKTLGCKVNQYESEGIIQNMIESGFKLSSNSKKPDLMIINTCSVTEKASMRSKQAIRKAIRNNSDTKMIVTGCDVQVSSEEISKIYGVDFVIPHNCKHKILENITSEKINDKDIVNICDIKEDIFFSNLDTINIVKRTRPFIKIQDGCNSFCTYCIVPYTRGRSISLPARKIIKKINNYRDIGYKEIVLTGIHIGSYGKDLPNKINFYELLCNIVNNNCINRTRISSIEPRELTDDIIYLTQKTSKGRSRVCQHFHIPLQSGDDFILNSMNRPYNSEYFKNLIKKILLMLPDCAIGLDVLVGFPGETDAAFNNTYNLIKELEISYLHIFPFSARPGTPAWSYLNKVSTKIIRERCMKLKKLSIQKQRNFYKRFLNKTVSILVENRKNNYNKELFGFSENYIPIYFNGSESMNNTIQDITINKITKDNRVKGSL